MIRIFIVSIIIFTLALNCDQWNNPEKVEVNSSSLRQMVLWAINGDTVTNNKLSGLINLNFPINKKYNKLSIDSIQSQDGSYLYRVLLEYPNPVYNCFSVFDARLNALIIDRSLNGYINYSTFRKNDLNFIKITETYLSKDIFELNRLSLYLIDSAEVSLVFRSYSRLKTPDNEFTQNIIELNGERIKTEIYSSKISALTNKGDIFLFDDDFRKYISSSDIFSGFVRNEVKMLSYPYSNDLFSDYESAMHSTEDGDSVLKNIDADVKNFKLTLAPGWIEDSSLTISRNINISLFGVTYVNKSAGSVINVAPIALRDSSELYSVIPLKNIQTGNYTVRYSDKKDTGTAYLQYFEYSFCGKKFLIIFEANKQNYERNKTMYEKIINSFTIDC